ncbi:hypothetical protein HHK36_000614 [Tetracentron sinense]|uniref:EGF-like calcium-binding domain-containing protein n=1 Tax=Tetracentron sinense TaxID=13715 RepID=A0A834ZSI2_TETSI|nr:hypothetical protein HHK36_000614 [Tetracentron sinense]
MNNGGCWSESRNGNTFSACSGVAAHMAFAGMVINVKVSLGVAAHMAFAGMVINVKVSFCDIIECKEGLACDCDGRTCKNTWGGYDCECKADLLYIMEQDTCIDRNSSKFRWFLTLLVLAGVVGSGIAGYIFYKYRFRSYMDSEIMAIMSQ